MVKLLLTTTKMSCKITSVNKYIVKQKRQIFKTRKYQDPLLHMRYNPFLRSRAQAWYLLQEWTLEFEDYCTLWTVDRWYCRGRGIGDLVMVRKDVEKGWTLENCEIVTRKEQLRRTRFREHGKGKNLNGTSG